MRRAVSDNQFEEVMKFCYLGSRITYYGQSKEDIKSRLALAKKAFLAKRSPLVSNIGLNLRKQI